mgnify:CR=1 FL=1
MTRKFTWEGLNLLRADHNVSWAIPDIISYTLAFKQMFRAFNCQGYTGKDAFCKLDYNREIQGRERIYNTTERIRRAAIKLSEGLC